MTRMIFGTVLDGENHQRRRKKSLLGEALKQGKRRRRQHRCARRLSGVSGSGER